MAQSSAALAHGNNPVPIIGPEFCSPYPVDLSIVRKVLSLTDDSFMVADVNGDVMFKVKEPVFGLHDKRVLIDATGAPIVTLREKIMSMHDRWEIFKGESNEPSDLLFTVKRSSLVQFKIKLDVFLASNTNEEACDFKIKGSWFERSCTVYAGETTTIVAKMHKKHSAQSILLGKDNFSVTVYPHVDYAFIVALFVILDDVNKEDRAE